MQRLIWFTICVTAVCVSARHSTAEGPSYGRDVRPILSDKCYACHGPDERTREADLRLDTRSGSRADLGGYAAIVPGQPESSTVMERITSDDADERMPPAESHKTLTTEEIETLRAWIANGAEYTVHWAYRPLERPALPSPKLPSNVEGDAQGAASHPIDAFINATLVEQHLTAADMADRPTLVRRLWLDLLGMPPSPEDVERFVNDESPNAWESQVDRVLSDRRFGERMAVYWLDLVRYADTIGYHSDNTMEVSAYRDYVIRAFNTNKPFDQFTIEQLAGDLLPEPTQEQRIGSGYNRLLQTTEEGGAQAKEYVAIYAADRVRNVSGVWLGATVGCAQCHDHKYDPITTRDFYSLAAFFADIKEPTLGRRQPNLTIITPEEQAHIDRLTADIAARQPDALLESDVELALRVQEGQRAWEAESLQAIDKGTAIWQVAEIEELIATNGVTLTKQSDGSVLSSGSDPATCTYTVDLSVSGTIRSLRLEAMRDPSFKVKEGFSRGNGNFVLTNVRMTLNDEPIVIATAHADFEQPNYPATNLLDDDKQSGWAVAGHQRKTDELHAVVFTLTEALEVGGESQILRVELLHDSPFKQHAIGRFRLSVTDAKQEGVLGDVLLPESVISAMRTPVDKREGAQQELLRQRYREISPELKPSQKEAASFQKELARIQGKLQTMLISESLETPRMTRVLPRGNWQDDSGEVVLPSVPAFLSHRPIDGRRASRLDLARWIVDESNPLTSRNAVNRLWKLFYGHGLSRNLNDIGGQGESPTHPELLDWLAVEFRSSGWDVKHLVKLLVTSDAYRRSSVPSPEHVRLDLGNRWYARQSRWRIDAEFVRDTALQISGLLEDDQLGGPSVKPYQPEGYWQHLNFPKRTWQAGKGESLHRRTLYTFWCRTFLHPSLLAFDAPSREECTAERARSNIPQQALVLLNDPIFVEASRVFAARIAQFGGTVEHKIDWAVREAFTRDIDDRESSLLRMLYESQRERYAAEPEEASRLIHVGEAPLPDDLDPVELAAWTQVARTLLNAYEATARF